MKWSGTFFFGEACAAYVGPADDNDLHEHAAYQIVLSNGESATVVDALGKYHQGHCILIKPLTAHAVRSKSSLTLIYLDPQFAIAMGMVKYLNGEEIIVMDADRLPFDHNIEPKNLMTAIADLAIKTPSSVDPRLVQALSNLRENLGHISIAETAKQCGISESRLRTIVREKYNVPLSTWLIWRKLECSAKALSSGANLADAALIGGFSDQAHFTRAMRRMLGITPSIAAKSLRNQT